jgi:ABC-type transporter Mla subunit MlaD
VSLVCISISALEAENEALARGKVDLLETRAALASQVEELEAELARLKEESAEAPPLATTRLSSRMGSTRSATYGEMSVELPEHELADNVARASSRGSAGARRTLRSAAPGAPIEGLEAEEVPGISAEEERQLRGSLKQAETKVEQVGMENDRLREEVRALMAPGREAVDGDERLRDAMDKIQRLEQDNSKLREEVGSLLGELDQVVADNQLLIQDNQQLIDQNTELQQTGGRAGERERVPGADGEGAGGEEGEEGDGTGGVEYQQLFSDNMKLASDNRQLLEDNNRLFADNKKIIADLNKLQEHGDTLYQENCRLSEDLEKAVQQQQALRDELVAAGQQLDGAQGPAAGAGAEDAATINEKLMQDCEQMAAEIEMLTTELGKRDAASVPGSLDTPRDFEALLAEKANLEEDNKVLYQDNKQLALDNKEMMLENKRELLRTCAHAAR